MHGWALVVWGLGIGLLQGFVHCSGMCGPFVLAFSLALEGGDRTAGQRVLPLFLAHNAGRIATFTVLGAVFGGVAHYVNLAARLTGVEAAAGFAGGAVMIGWAVATARSGSAAGSWERWSLLGIPAVGRWLQRLYRTRRPGDAFLAGAVLGLHPCGLIFTVLLAAAAAASALTGGLTLAAFGIGTVPALLSVATAGWYGRRRLKGPGYTRLAAGLIGLSGLLFVLRGMAVNGWIPDWNPWLF
ncbi:Sulfite exporter TauE/SafE family protein [Candidatus Hydrogenisulfobacillus filiaventi]|uniref:Sulfite exporter TauE/SafE family protein n=1 Tax=Candidatus Hydrogenisulfobacillus filiaventi TaxID=2707344 RepID=A0A6F8ZIF1_9FIRM|nr:Sulfite exporter TauE/SafE family protein [Candidatus Hydrogenisulfobacillus filiaventi]